jgi:hypothetical protein
MSGPRFKSLSKVAGVAAAAGVILASVPVAQAEIAQRPLHHRTHATETYRTVGPYSRAQYGAGIPNTTVPTNACIGGYRYMDRIDDANRTPEEDEVPLRCR